MLRRPAARQWHPGDCARGMSVREGLEDPLYDNGFGGVNTPVSANRLAISVDFFYHVIAIGIPPCGFAFADPAFEAAFGLKGQVLKEERVHGALEADMQLVDQAFGKRVNADTSMV